VTREPAGLDIRIGGEHASAPRFQQVRDAPARAAKSDNAYGDTGIAVSALADVGAVDRWLAPAARFDEAVSLADAFQQREHQRESAFRDAAPVRLRGAVGDEHAEGTCRFDVDVVDSDCVLSDKSQLRRDRQERVVHVAAERRAEQGVGVDGERCDLRAVRVGRGNDHTTTGSFDQAMRLPALVDGPVDQYARPAQATWTGRLGRAVDQSSLFSAL
jgi:hypothetical protein